MDDGAACCFVCAVALLLLATLPSWGVEEEGDTGMGRPCAASLLLQLLFEGPSGLLGPGGGDGLPTLLSFRKAFLSVGPNL